ncbi:MAG: helix-turn-helix domain-containing protein [Flavobacteriales bacterium]
MAGEESFREIRKALKIKLDDIAYYLGVTRSWVSKYETGAVPDTPATHEKIKAMRHAVRRAGEHPGPNPWLDDAGLRQQAQNRREKQRSNAAVRAEVYRIKLEEMSQTYAECVQALDTMGAMLNDPQCPDDIKEWINVTAPRIVATARKNSPDEQVTLELKWLALRGKAELIGE